MAFAEDEPVAGRLCRIRKINPQSLPVERDEEIYAGKGAAEVGASRSAR